jgi:hypothetical protein
MKRKEGDRREDRNVGSAEASCDVYRFKSN